MTMPPAVTAASSTTIVWFRRDLRLADNPALHEAIARGGPVIPVFIWAPDEEAPWQPGAASRWWLHHSLESLARGLAERGTRLILRRGPTLPALQQLIAETGADAVMWNRLYEPSIIRRDIAIKESLKSASVRAQSFNAALLFEPWAVEKGTGGPFQVYTPFWRACLAQGEPALPAPVPAHIPTPSALPSSVDLASLDLLPKIAWDTTMRASWQPGEVGAWSLLDRFLERAVFSYSDDRNRPDVDGTARLSAHLHWGEIGPRQVWAATREAIPADAPKAARANADKFLGEVGWREFGHHLLYHFPHTAERPLRADFERFEWLRDPATLRRWQNGRTGYPIIDAGMRELWATGIMHNRVRMIVASFLVKDLLHSWVDGARWFWDTLVDADLASNTLGWQWAAGCGADAAPYFRVFNPVLQGEKFDPRGIYTRRWVPELAKVSDKWLHKVWEAPAAELRAAGVVLGEHYPRPIVDHGEARQRALAVFERIRGPYAEKR
jgi:deoxyribodipyrimidine photo-lyase